MADTDLGAGAPVNLRFVPIPDGASFVDPVQWSVSDESKATIGPNGDQAMVTPVDGANGEVTVTATSGVATGRGRDLDDPERRARDAVGTRLRVVEGEADLALSPRRRGGPGGEGRKRTA